MVAWAHFAARRTRSKFRDANAFARLEPTRNARGCGPRHCGSFWTEDYRLEQAGVRSVSRGRCTSRRTDADLGNPNFFRETGRRTNRRGIPGAFSWIFSAE